jgi:glutaredoxin
MDVTVLGVPDCPHATPAAHLLAEVLAKEGYGHLTVGVEVIEDHEHAQAHGFIGSPSFFLDGIDLFAVDGAPAAVACRTYATASGLSSLPDRTTLGAAVRTRLAI